MIAQGGLKPSIDFSGGSVLEVKMDVSKINSSQELEERIDKIVDISSLQLTSQKTLILKSKSIANEQKDAVVADLGTEFGTVEMIRFETVGPVIGRELLLKTVFSVLIVSMVIMLYVMNQFKDLRYGVSAILAMLHDTFVLFCAFALLGVLYNVEIDALFVTAVLTTLSFSVHDTIVTFDRIREIRKKEPNITIKEASNKAVLQTLSRSLNNSLTIIIMLATLVLLGGTTLRWFAVALLVGSITGTYSSTFTAIPLLLLWDDVAKRWSKGK